MADKSLLIHIGFPKTATTTIQNSLFYDLYCKNHITFLGRADQYKKFQKKGLDLAAKIRHNFNIDLSNIDFEPGNNNLYILSEEQLTLPNIYKTDQYNSKDIPWVLKSKFEPYFNNIRILIVIRNQADLIRSLYSHHYQKFVSQISDMDPEEHLFGDENGIEAYNMLDFANTYLEYSRIFGEGKIKLLLFEDLQTDCEFFSKEIADLLSIQWKYVLNILQKSHLNEKKKRDNQDIIKIRNTNYDIIFSLLRRIGISKIMGRRFKKRILPKKMLKVPQFSEKLSIKIQDEYKNSNLQLCELGIVPKHKLKLYKYI